MTNIAELQQRHGAAKEPGSMKDIATMPKAKQFPAMLQTFQSEIRRALPAHMTPDRMARIALTCFRSNPKLAQCEPASVFAAVLQAAQLGLEPGLLGYAYLIPFNNNTKDANGNWTKKMECQLQIGYQGLVDLARRSGRVKSLEAHAVYSADKWRCSFGLQTIVEHEPNWDGDRGELRLVYAVAHLSDGGTHVEVMSKAEIEKIRDRSQNVQSAKKYNKQTPWDTDFEQMALKTVLRRICKFLPKSIELATAVALDERSATGRAQDLGIDDAIDGTWSPVEQIGHEDEEQAPAEEDAKPGPAKDEQKKTRKAKPADEDVLE